MPTYEDLKGELLEISKILENFPESVKGEVFRLLVSKYTGGQSDILSDSKDPGSMTTPPKQKRKKYKTTKKVSGEGAKWQKTGGKESYTIDTALNLRGDKSIPSFKVFHDEKQPSSAREFNAVAIYYLIKMMGEDDVTLDQVYTCYREISKKPPKEFRQSFIDTKNKNGWVEFTDSDRLNIPHRGIVFVEHDLPKNK